MPRPRRRALVLLGASLTLFTVGTSVQAGWLLVLAACLLGAIVAGSAMALRMTHGIELERRAPAEAFQGDEVHTSLVVSNRARGTRLALDLWDEHLDPARAFVERLDPGETAIVEMRRRAARRGIHERSEVVVASSAPLGVAGVRRRVAVTSPTVVYPALVPLDSLSFLEAAPTRERAIHTAPRRGAGPDYLGIREYRVGDSMRHVHWPSTARHGALMVREFEREQTRRLAVLIDSSTDLPVRTGPTPLDVCCSVAASVAFAARGAGQGVRLVAAVGGEPTSIARTDPAGTLRWLAELRPGGGLSIVELAERLGDEVLGAATVMVVMPTWRSNDSATAERAVGSLAVRTPRVVAVLVEAHTFAGTERTPRQDPGEVDALAATIRATGALVARLEAGSDLAPALSRIEEAPAWPA